MVFGRDLATLLRRIAHRSRDIRTIINLMEESEVNHQGRPFAAYEQIATQLVGQEAIDCSRYFIPDVSVPPPLLMSKILDHTDRSLADGRPVYVPCWGGVGMAWLVCPCYSLVWSACRVGEGGCPMFYDPIWGQLPGGRLRSAQELLEKQYLRP